jgi:endonuclease VIII
MPEGPSIVLAREAMQFLANKKIASATGTSTKVNFETLPGTRIKSFESWGEHLLICFDDFTLRVHFLMFGSYAVDEPKPNRIPKLALVFTRKHALYLYACSITTLSQPINEVYDWSKDVMSEKWNSRKASLALKRYPKMLITDALLNQTIFAGVGNIIKNEVLYRVGIHPKSEVGQIPPAKRRELMREVVNYSFQFLEWRREFTLKKHWQAYAKKKCPRDKASLIKEYLGTTKRRTFYCNVCQKLYV